LLASSNILGSTVDSMEKWTCLGKLFILLLVWGPALLLWTIWLSGWFFCTFLEGVLLSLLSVSFSSYFCRTSPYGLTSWCSFENVLWLVVYLLHPAYCWFLPNCQSEDVPFFYSIAKFDWSIPFNISLLLFHLKCIFC